MTRSNHRTAWTLVALVSAALFGTHAAHASLTRNAAGPRNMGESGALTVDTAVEHEREGDGRVLTFETGVQYQLSTRLQLLVEAIVFERARADAGGSASGLGDTDVTMSWLAVEGRGAIPSVALGAKAKLPTAGSDEIGTGSADYSALLALEEEHGELELNLELEFVTFGAAPGEDLKDQFLYSFGAELGLTDFLAVYAEAFGNSAPTAGESRTDAALLGVELDHELTKVIAPYLSFEVDTEGVSTGRVGIEWTW